MVSLPHSPTRMSSPVPPVITSSPSPPYTTSESSPPIRESFPAWPNRATGPRTLCSQSLPSPPKTFTAKRPSFTTAESSTTTVSSPPKALTSAHPTNVLSTAATSDVLPSKSVRVIVTPSTATDPSWWTMRIWSAASVPSTRSTHSAMLSVADRDAAGMIRSSRTLTPSRTRAGGAACRNVTALGLRWNSFANRADVREADRVADMAWSPVRCGLTFSPLPPDTQSGGNHATNSETLPTARRSPSGAKPWRRPTAGRPCGRQCRVRRRLPGCSSRRSSGA